MQNTQIKYRTSKANYSILKPGQNDFVLKDGYLSIPRAGFEINNSCPYEYKMVIVECIRNGWLTPVAHVYNHEITFARLKND